MINLDVLDRKILYYLDGDCRQSKIALAKRLRISRTTLSYRIDQLKEKGIIKGTFAEINNLNLGYMNIRLFLKLGNCTSTEEKELKKFLKHNKNALWLSTVIGPWDLDFVFGTKDLHKFQVFYAELKETFNAIILKTQIDVLEEIVPFAKHYLIKNMIESKLSFSKKILFTKKHTLDSLSLTILSLLSNNADMSILDLAKKTKSSINTIKKKMKELEDKDIILSYRLYIDTNALGFEFYKWHLVLKNYITSDISKLKTYLSQFSFVTYFDRYTGNDDLEIELHLPSKVELLNFKKAVKEKFGTIIAEEYHLQFPEEVVFNYFPAN